MVRPRKQVVPDLIWVNLPRTACTRTSGKIEGIRTAKIRIVNAGVTDDSIAIRNRAVQCLVKAVQP